MHHHFFIFFIYSYSIFYIGKNIHTYCSKKPSTDRKIRSLYVLSLPIDISIKSKIIPCHLKLLPFITLLMPSYKKKLF